MNLQPIQVNKRAYEILTKYFCGVIFHRREISDVGKMLYYIKPAYTGQVEKINHVQKLTGGNPL